MFLRVKALTSAIRKSVTKRGHQKLIFHFFFCLFTFQYYADTHTQKILLGTASNLFIFYIICLVLVLHQQLQLILKYFDMFLKLKDLTGSTAFQVRLLANIPPTALRVVSIIISLTQCHLNVNILNGLKCIMYIGI